MLNALPRLDDLPRQSASQVKNKWGDVVRLVHQAGSVAVTNHSAVEMVLVDAVRYRQLAEQIEALQAREQTVLDELASRFDARLAALQQPAAGDGVQALLDSGGRLARRPKAGSSY